jgi:hypothetical protein
MDAESLELLAVVSIRQPQRRRRVLPVHGLAQRLLAHESHPLQAKPVSSSRTLPVSLALSDAAALQSVSRRSRTSGGVDKAEHGLKGVGFHVEDPDAARGRLRHRAEELGAEDRRAHGEQDFVRLELPVLDMERHVGTHLALEQLQHLLGHVRRRHDDGVACEIMLRCHGGSARVALPAEIHGKGYGNAIIFDRNVLGRYGVPPTIRAPGGNVDAKSFPLVVVAMLTRSCSFSGMLSPAG